MKLDRWAQLQTTAIIKKLCISIVFVAIPTMIVTLFLNQSAHVEAMFNANSKTILSALQTGDLLLLEKSLSNYKNDSSIYSFKLFDKDGILITSYSNVPKPFFSMTKIIEVNASDTSNWGKFEISWTLKFDLLVYSLIAMLITTGFVSVFVFNSWHAFSKKLILSIAQIQPSINQKNMPDLISQIDDLKIVFEQLSQFQKQAIESEKLKAQIASEKALVTLSQKIVHDIRTPLSSIALLISPIKIQDERKQLIDASIKRMYEICTELLQESKGKNQLLENLDTAITQAISELKVIHNKFAIDLKIPDDAINLFPPDIEFKSIFSNLLQNSLQALHGPDGKIKVEVMKNGDQVYLSIEDNGKGIPEQVLEKLGKERVTFGKGTLGNGLGFYNANLWALKNKGNLEVSSKVNEGTVVRLNFQL